MKIALKKDYEIGVIIGRFQTHTLHQGHIDLLKHVTDNHERVVILLGTSSVLCSKRNPLDFATRKAMIENLSYIDEKVTILPLPDCKSNEVWSTQVDRKVHEVFPLGHVVIYGSRDSFIPYYTGSYDTCELEPDTYYKATDLRKIASNQILRSSDFRAGAIYATYNTYPTTYPVVDVLILDEKGRILLGRKPDEKEYRFIGGFVDPTDVNLEAAAAREAREETGLEVAEFSYLCSAKIDDWRYRNEPGRGMMSSVFTCRYIFGAPTPMDDICELKWFFLEEALAGDLVKSHYDILSKNFDRVKETVKNY